MTLRVSIVCVRIILPQTKFSVHFCNVLSNFSTVNPIALLYKIGEMLSFFLRSFLSMQIRVCLDV